VNLEAIIEQVERYTWRQLLSEFRDALGGCDRVRLEEDFEVVNLEAVIWERGATGAETLFIG